MCAMGVMGAYSVEYARVREGGPTRDDRTGDREGPERRRTTDERVCVCACVCVRACVCDVVVRDG